jgi:energy-coupling factor transporter ATP-binding protein EcfA2
MSIRIKQIKFKAGMRSDSPPLSIAPQHMIVLVGPNNSGKSKAIKEMSVLCNAFSGPPFLVVGELDFEVPPTASEIMDLMHKFVVRKSEDPLPQGGFMMTRRRSSFGQVSDSMEHRITDELVDAWMADGLSLRPFLIGPYTLGLDGNNRFAMAQSQPLGDLKEMPTNHLAALFRDDTQRSRLREMVKDTFGSYLVIDPTQGGILQFRMSTRPPTTTSEERGLGEDAIKFHSEATQLDEFGDGVRAFIGILSPIISFDYKIVLLDEPEAFLHPPQARRLGAFLARLASEREGTTVAATHSPDFVMGCLEGASNSTTIIRLTHDASGATARALEASDIVPLFRDPLMRSTGVLNALFHRCALIMEADADRSFYEEINRRLNEAARGIRDAIFLNAQNKQTIQRLVAPLRKIGIPAVAVVDLDFLVVSNASEWPALLSACGIMAGQIAVLETERSYVVDMFASKDQVKQVGLAGLSLTDNARAESLLRELARYGLFLVPVGELERWLPHIGTKAKKSDWIVQVFEKMGSNPSASNYLKPGTDDVWCFLDEISSWVSDPDRLGMN